MTSPSHIVAQDGERRANQRVWALVGLLTAAAAGATAATVRITPVESADVTLALILAIGFAAVERLVLSVRIGEEVQNLSLSELPLIIGLFSLPPHLLLAARLIGSAVGVRTAGKAVVKTAFNTCHMWWETLIAIWIFAVADPASVLDGLRATQAALGVAVAATLSGAVAVMLVISAHSGRWRGDIFTLGLRQALLPVMATTGLTMVVLVLAESTPFLLWAPAIALAMLFSAYRAHSALLQVNEWQREVLGFAAEVTGQSSPGRTAEEIAEAAQHLLGAASVAVGLYDGNLGVTTWYGGEMAARAVQADTAPAGLIARPLGAFPARIAILPGPSTRPSDSQEQMLELILSHGAVALASARHSEALKAQALDAARRARQDELTELANRTSLQEALDDAIAAGDAFSLLLLDLDDFKEINDALGHAAGDHVLMEIARRFDRVTHDVVLLARLGGDEFAVVMSGGSATALEIASRLHSCTDAAVEVDSYAIEVKASIGIAAFPDHGADTGTLMKHADLAMYESKRARSGTRVFGAESGGRAVRQLAVSTGFRSALNDGQVSVVVQPIVSLQDGRPMKAEALARWTHPDLGVIRPDEFIAVAEQSGGLQQLTRAVLSESLMWHRRWLDEGLSLPVSVNLSARSLLDADMPRLVARLLDEHGLGPSSLILELTESSIISDPTRTLGVLRRLARVGVSLSIDDFGTGYSSLAYLRSVPATEVKIDKSFVLPIAHDDTAAPVVSGIVRLCHELGFTVVAEGIENAPVQSVLRRIGCDMGQGYFVARPMPPELMVRWARSGAIEANVTASQP